MGEVTVDREVEKLKIRAEKLGIKVNVIHTENNPVSDKNIQNDSDISIIVTGNPRGLISCHHEKLVLIDPECPSQAFAFSGGFDIARGRYDQPEHLVKNYFVQDEPNSRLFSFQPLLRTDFLWHDIQILIKGPAVQLLYLHFLQRWSHSITTNTHITRNIEVKLPPEISGSCKKHRLINLAGEYKNIEIGLERTWKGVFDTYYRFAYKKRSPHRFSR